MTDASTQDRSFLLTGRRAAFAWVASSLEGFPLSDGGEYRLARPGRPAGLSSLFLMAPEQLQDFLSVLHERETTLNDWRRFLSVCRVAEGAVSENGTRLETWRETGVLSALEEESAYFSPPRIRPGSGPALLPTARGRVPLSEPFLHSLRQGVEFVGLGGEGVGRGSLFLWSVPHPRPDRERDQIVQLAFHELEGSWQVLFAPWCIEFAA